MLINDVAHAAFMFLHDKPWEKLTDGGALVFGVEDDEGLSYAVLTGEENGCSLALCPDAQALAGYAALLNAKKNRADEMELISLQLDQDFIEIRRDQPDEFHLNRWLKVFGVEEEKWPKYLTVMRRHEPGHLPRYISDEEGVKLAHALHAANWLSAGSGAEAMKALSGQNGENGMLCVRVDEDFDFTCRVEAQPGGVTAKYPSLSLQDELAARRLRRLPVSGAEVTCAIRMLPVPMDEEAERVAMVMLLLDDRMGVAAAPVIADYEKQYPELASEYIAYVEECGRPKSITAADPRAYCLLNELAGQMSTPIRRAESSDAINEAMRSMLNFMKGSVQKESKSSGRAAKASGRGICLYC